MRWVAYWVANGQVNTTREIVSVARLCWSLMSKIEDRSLSNISLVNRTLDLGRKSKEACLRRSGIFSI